MANSLYQQIIDKALARTNPQPEKETVSQPSASQDRIDVLETSVKALQHQVSETNDRIGQLLDRLEKKVSQPTVSQPETVSQPTVSQPETVKKPDPSKAVKASPGVIGWIKLPDGRLAEYVRRAEIRDAKPGQLGQYEKHGNAISYGYLFDPLTDKDREGLALLRRADGEPMIVENKLKTWVCGFAYSSRKCYHLDDDGNHKKHWDSSKAGTILLDGQPLIKMTSAKGPTDGRSVSNLSYYADHQLTSVSQPSASQPETVSQPSASQPKTTDQIVRDIVIGVLTEKRDKLASYIGQKDIDNKAVALAIAKIDNEIAQYQETVSQPSASQPETVSQPTVKNGCPICDKHHYKGTVQYFANHHEPERGSIAEWKLARKARGGLVGLHVSHQGYMTKPYTDLIELALSHGWKPDLKDLD